jgi:hypothetical protein
MASTLTAFNENNRIIGPRSLMIDRAPLGYTSEDGMDFNPNWAVEAVSGDQKYTDLGANVTDIKGTVEFKVFEVTTALIPKLFDLAAGTTLTGAPLAGTRFSNMPNMKLTKRLIEWWGLAAGGAGDVLFMAVKGILAAAPKESYGRKKQLLLDMKFNLCDFSSGYPPGIRDVYTGVSGALTLTSSPADDAVSVAITVAPTFTFNKCLSALALLDEHWTFTKDTDSSAVPYAVSFGTRTVDGVTITDPHVIVLTPSSSLTNSAAYTITTAVGIPAVDGTTLATAVTTNFTCVAA